MSSYHFNLALIFDNVVKNFPKKKALFFDNSEFLTFEELDVLSNKIANFLLEKNLSKNSIIGILNSKSKVGFGIMLAAIKTGLCYVNFDSNLPYERLKRILLNSNPSLIFVDENIEISKMTNLIEDFNFVDYKELNYYLNTANKKINFNIKSVLSSQPLYIMYTSGSTGFPKGAVMTHQNIINLIYWAKNRFSINEEDSFTNVNPLYFDNSVFDFYVSIFNGNTLCVFSYETMKVPQSIIETITNLKPTIWFSVPSLLVYLLTMKLITKKSFTSIRIISFGGEGFPKVNLNKLYNILGNQCRFINVYGPTECSCICSAFDINESNFIDLTQLTPLGNIAENFSYQILEKDENGIGELLLIGPQVGLGYYNDYERTKQNFIQNPKHNFFKEISYLTGDLVCEDENNILYFKGRKDNQIKFMGYRIELEEIDNAFLRINEVTESATIFQKNDFHGGKIISFVSLNNEFTIDDLYMKIKDYLPEYMIPKAINILDILPKNSNGKIDRLQLLERLK